MPIALRSHLIAGVAMVGASAIAVAPMAPTPLSALPTRAIAVENTAMVLQPVNPFAAFQPVVSATFEDLYSAIQLELADPLPILRSFLSNQTNYVFTGLAGLSQATYVLGTGAFELPGQVLLAAQQALGGDVPGAIKTIEGATLGPLSKATAAVVGSVQKILLQELTVAQNLVVAIPQAGGVVFAATINAVNTIIQATLEAGQGLVDAAKTLQPVAIWNAAVQGVADVALVTEQVTIGTGLPTDEVVDAPVAEKEIVVEKTPRSIRLGLAQARSLIDDALNPKKFAVASSTAADTPAKNTRADSAPEPDGSSTVTDSDGGPTAKKTANRSAHGKRSAR